MHGLYEDSQQRFYTSDVYVKQACLLAKKEAGNLFLTDSILTQSVITIAVVKYLFATINT